MKDSFSLTLAQGDSAERNRIDAKSDLDQHRQDFAAYCKVIQSELNSPLSESPTDLPLQGDPHRVFREFCFSETCRYAITKSSRFGLAPFLFPARRPMLHLPGHENTPDSANRRGPEVQSCRQQLYPWRHERGDYEAFGFGGDELRRHYRRLSEAFRL